MHNFNFYSFVNETQRPILIARCSNYIAIVSAMFTFFSIIKGCSDEASFERQIKDTNKRIDSLVKENKITKNETLMPKSTPRKEKK